MRIYFVLLRFALISMCTAVIDNLLFSACYLYTGNKLTSQAVGRLGAMSFNFAAVKRMVFNSRGRALREFLQYAALVAVSGTLSYGLIVLFTTHLSMGVLKAKLVAESILFLANFLVQRDLIFTSGGQPAVPQAGAGPLAAQPAAGAETDLPH
jgi:putative flippase GtrA